MAGDRLLAIIDACIIDACINDACINYACINNVLLRRLPRTVGAPRFTGCGKMLYGREDVSGHGFIRAVRAENNLGL